jgi:hypothetical protein
MKLTRCVLAFALLLSSYFAISAQEPAASSQAAGESSGPTIETKFDSAKNETTVGFRMLQITGSETQKLLISVQATYATQTPKDHPDDVVFIISALNTAYRYPDVNRLNITVDGKRLDPVLLLNLDKRPAEPLFLETLGTRMKYDVFMKLTKGKSVQLEFSETSFALRDSDLALLAKLADLLHL